MKTQFLFSCLFKTVLVKITQSSWEASGRVQASGQISQSLWGFPGGSDSKESICNAGDLGSIPGLERSPGGGHGHPLQYFCLKNPHGQRSLAGYNPWGRKESGTTEQLSTHKGPRQGMAEETASRQELLSSPRSGSRPLAPQPHQLSKTYTGKAWASWLPFTPLTLVGNSSFPRRHLIGET